ncbi:MAG TPA: hypothetical protein DCM87_08965 [Planctomycetes bacterium]|nr:hypothetical protein [Planctomycetota bacterium]
MDASADAMESRAGAFMPQGLEFLRADASEDGGLARREVLRQHKGVAVAATQALPKLLDYGTTDFLGEPTQIGINGKGIDRHSSHLFVVR